MAVRGDVLDELLVLLRRPQAPPDLLLVAAGVVPHLVVVALKPSYISSHWQWRTAHCTQERRRRKLIQVPEALELSVARGYKEDDEGRTGRGERAAVPRHAKCIHAVAAMQRTQGQGWAGRVKARAGKVGPNLCMQLEP